MTGIRVGQVGDESEGKAPRPIFGLRLCAKNFGGTLRWVQQSAVFRLDAFPRGWQIHPCISQFSSVVEQLIRNANPLV
jgi:hypothetical protein